MTLLVTLTLFNIHNKGIVDSWTRISLVNDLRDCCNFHKHRDDFAAEACWRRQLDDGAFCTGFLRACMSEIYDIEHQEAEAELKAKKEFTLRKTEEKAKTEAEEKAKVEAETKA
jgi:hypothetical protein